jgi:hypothetical protein
MAAKIKLSQHIFFDLVREFDNSANDMVINEHAAVGG